MSVKLTESPNRSKRVGPFRIVSGSSNSALTYGVAARLGVEPVPVNLRQFANTERFVEISSNVRGCDVFLFQSLSAPVNDHIIELALLLDALRRSSAARITAVLPYFAYGRNDKKDASRIPISAKMVASLICNAGADRVLSMDLHSEQIQGFFDVPIDTIYSKNIMVKDIFERNFESLTIVSPDIDGVARARQVSNSCSADLVIVHKKSDLLTEKIEVVIGDVAGRDCVIIDDIVDSGATLSSAAVALMDCGAKSVSAYATHGVLSGNSQDVLARSCLKEIVITDTVQTDNKNLPQKFRVISSVELFARAIENIHSEESVSILR